jgi:glycosyltransferase involved in cell wall biosynthesis
MAGRHARTGALPRVTVVIPCYNRTAWIPAALSSVLAQTEPDLEVVVVDDGSRPPVDAWCPGDVRVRWVRQPNRGAAAARNRGVAHAQSDYVAFLDSDDRFLPEKLERQLALMDANPEVLLSHTSYARIDPEGHRLATIDSGRFGEGVYPDIYAGCPISTSTVVIRRAAIAQGPWFDETAHVAEDILLWARLAKRGRILGLDEVLSEIRIHGRNAALTPRAQIVGLRTLLTHGVRRDPDVDYVSRRRLSRRLFTHMATVYRRQGRRGMGAACRLLAFAAWPPEERFLRRAAGQLPGPARRWLKAVVGGTGRSQG